MLRVTCLLVHCCCWLAGKVFYIHWEVPVPSLVALNYLFAALHYFSHIVYLFFFCHSMRNIPMIYDIMLIIATFSREL